MNSCRKRAPVSIFKPSKIKTDDGTERKVHKSRFRTRRRHEKRSIFNGYVKISILIVIAFELFVFEVYASLMLLYTLWFSEIENFKHRRSVDLYERLTRGNSKKKVFYAPIKHECMDI